MCKSYISIIALLLCSFMLVGCTDSAQKDDDSAVSIEEKRAELLRKVDRDYSNPDYHYQLGRVYQAEGKWVKAEHEFDLALSFDPIHRRAQAGKVKVLMDGGQMDKANVLLNEYIKQASSSAAGSLELGIGLQEQGLNNQALHCYQQALSLAPDSAKVNRQLGYYYLAKGNNDKAIDFLSRSFQLNPNQPDVAGELGKLGVAVRIPKKNAESGKEVDKAVE